jgi:hypothetical protein
LLRIVMAAPWSVRIQDEAPLALMVVAEGEAWVTPDGGEPVRLGPGDVAIARGPDPYTVGDTPGRAPHVVIGPGQVCTDSEGHSVAETMSLGVRTWGNAAEGDTVMLCGAYEEVATTGVRVLGALPPLLVVRRDDWGSPLVDILCAEVTRQDMGQEVVLDRVLDLVVVSALRSWLARPDTEAPAWYRAHADEVVGRATAPAADQPRPSLDRCRAGARGRYVAGGAGATVHRAGGRASDDVPHQLSPGPGRRPAAPPRRHDRGGGRRGGLRHAVRAECRVQAGARHQPPRPPAPRHRGHGVLVDAAYTSGPVTRV